MSRRKITNYIKHKYIAKGNRDIDSFKQMFNNINQIISYL